MEWISVDDRLPEEDIYVLCVSLEIFDCPVVCIANIDSIDNSWWADDGYLRKVTHWMPLPSPPEV